MRYTFIALLVVLSLAFVPALAQTAAPEKAKAAQTPAAQAPDAGVRVFIDPVTKRIRPPEPGEAEALAPGAQAPQAAPQAIFHRTGAVGLRLDDSFMSYFVATKNADGTLSFQCVAGKQAAESAVTQTVSKPAPKEKADVQ